MRHTEREGGSVAIFSTLLAEHNIIILTINCVLVSAAASFVYYL